MRLLIFETKVSIDSESGFPFSTFSTSLRKKSMAWNITSNNSGLSCSGTASIVFSRMMKNISSVRWATVIMELNSIMAEEPLIVCMIRKISFTSSWENVSACSAARTIPSSCSRSVFVSYRYMSRMLSFPLAIEKPPRYLKILLRFCLHIISLHYILSYRQNATGN